VGFLVTFYKKVSPNIGFLFSLAVFLCPGLSKKKSIIKGEPQSKKFSLYF